MPSIGQAVREAPAVRSPASYNVLRLHRWCQRYGVDEESLVHFSEADRPRARRIIWFAMNDTRSDYIGWDPSDLTDERNHEYGIYILPHGERVIERIAGSFPEFLEEFCLSRRANCRDMARGHSEVASPFPPPPACG